MDHYAPVATYSLASLLEAKGSFDAQTEPAQTLETPDDELEGETEIPTTIADVLNSSRERIAAISGVPVEMVRLQLTIG